MRSSIFSNSDPEKEEYTVSEIVLEGKNISCRLSDKLILKEVNLQLKKGQLTGIIGPNGAGKTTLLKTLLKMDGLMRI